MSDFHASPGLPPSRSTTPNMTTSELPQWLQTATEKRKLRDDAIQKFIDAQAPLAEVLYLGTLERAEDTH